MRQVEVLVEICRVGVPVPDYQHMWDAGMDVVAAEETMVKAGETVIVPTGLKFAIPEGYEIQIRPRSGISARTPLRIPNAPGTVDSGYRDELGILVSNTSDPNVNPEDKAHAVDSAGNPEDTAFTIDSAGNGKGHYLIRKGDRIAQLVLVEVPRMKLVVVSNVAGIGADRGGGFGSTGFGSTGFGSKGYDAKEPESFLDASGQDASHEIFLHGQENGQDGKA
jgi:dUTP pyrophosphatase